MLNAFLQNKLAAAGVVILLLAGVWFSLNSSAAPGPVLQVEGPIAGDQELVTTLLTLKAVNLSGTIFSDPLFMSLQDFGKQILPEPVGRPNPFAPLQSQPAPTPSSQGTNAVPDARMFAPGR